MRSFANTVLQRSLVADAAKPVQFLRFAFGGGDIRVTTAPHDVSWDGFTWQGIGGELQLEAINESPDDRGGQFSLGLSGVDQSMLSAILAERYIGRALEVWLGWIAQATNLLANSGAESSVLTNTIVAVASGTVTKDQTVTSEGDYCAKVVCTATNDGASWRGDTTGNLAPVNVGTPYTFIVQLAQQSTGPQTIRLNILWRTAGHSNISTDTLDVVVQPGGYQRFALTATAPATAAEALPSATSQSGAFTFFADGVQFGPGPDQGLYQPTDGAAIQGGSVIVRPIGPASFFMNGGFEVEEETGRREGRTVKIQAKVSSRSSTLLVSRGFRTNRESHQQVFRTDQFFEFVPGLAGKQVTWGSKPYSLGQIAFGNTPYSPWRRG